MFLIYLFIFIFGLCVGSFINALVYRLQEKMPWVKARSICPECKTQLKWWHNIPLLSFIILCGRCAFCQKKIPWSYPLIEFFTGILFVIALIFFDGHYFSLFFQFFTIVVLVMLFLYDLKYTLIPDIISLPAIGVVLIFQLTYLFFRGQLEINNFLFIFLSAIIGGGWFAAQYLVSHGKWVGGGDIRLGILMGLVLPWPHIITGLSLAYIGGAFISLPLLLSHRKNLKSEIAFGVFLVPATIVALWWGDKIVMWYLNLI